ncbi:hypothetical protein LGK95_20795 [Clostridium algoriphilum]|uniref:hypothetical protein n=1 Tax=Clostridium algoriphilum TaxID=198347 RepID=UPI001CF2FBD5|nr:hypothetical protein [Clostridium algoriphilum]MCB2295903.1 hypothetical protein [Clostridium algoriphilum]
MITHQKITKTIFKLLIMAICLSLSVFILMACSNKTEKNNKNKTQNKTVAITKLTKIAFEKDNNVYLYDEINKQIKSLGDSSKSKDLLELSEDKTKLVFRNFNQEKEIYPPHINVYDVKTGELTDIVINDKSLQQIIDLKWIDDENILITGHINPSASGYAIYNIKSKAELISCVGTIRAVTMDEKKILYSDTPHTFPQPKANLYINGNKIYETTDVNEEIYDGAISKDGKMIAFRSWIEDAKNINGKTSAYLNTAKVNSDGKSISDLKKIVIDTDTTGDLKFNEKNNISIVGEEFTYKLQSSKLIKAKNTLPKETEISAEQLKKFKQILAKQFPNDSITDETLLEDIDIYNMVQF